MSSRSANFSWSY